MFRNALFHILAAAGAALCMAVAVWSFLGARKDQQRLAEVISQQKQSLAAASARQSSRDAALQDALAQIDRLKRTIQTPQQLVQEIPKYMPALPQPIALNLPQPTKDNPAPVATATIPQTDLKPIFDAIQQCRADQLRLTTCQSDRADDARKLTAITTSRDAAIKAAKGGSFWRRTRTVAKWVVIGAAIGYAAHH